ncbi:hypothetical protein ACP70R_032253 [Stipagrostis hirtigluma subsp. patula]
MPVLPLPSSTASLRPKKAAAFRRPRRPWREAPETAADGFSPECGTVEVPGARERAGTSCRRLE